MSNELMTPPGGALGPLRAADIRAQVNLIQEVMSAVMKDKEHYGKIPGCGDKPALFKAGAEKLMATFRIAADPEVEDLSTPDEAHYRVRVKGISASGQLLGAGVGEASSGEDKWKWRSAVCDQEFIETPEDRRRAKWKKGGDGAYQVKQVRTQAADVANTVLKMAKKRALVDMVLTVTAASDIFAQDIEELPEEMRDGEGGEDSPKSGLQPPQRKSSPPAQPAAQGQPPAPSGNVISDPQAKRFYAIYKNAGRTDEEVKAYLKAKYGIESSRAIPKNVYEEICEWAQANEPGSQG